MSSSHQLNLRITASILNRVSTSEGELFLTDLAEDQHSKEAEQLRDHIELMTEADVIESEVVVSKGGTNLKITGLRPLGESLVELLQDEKALEGIIRQLGLEVSVEAIRAVIEVGGKVLGDVLKADPEKKAARKKKREQKKQEKKFVKSSQEQLNEEKSLTVGEVREQLFLYGQELLSDRWPESELFFDIKDGGLFLKRQESDGDSIHATWVRIDQNGGFEGVFDLALFSGQFKPDQAVTDLMGTEWDSVEQFVENRKKRLENNILVASRMPFSSMPELDSSFNTPSKFLDEFFEERINKNKGEEFHQSAVDEVIPEVQTTIDKGPESGNPPGEDGSGNGDDNGNGGGTSGHTPPPEIIHNPLQLATLNSDSAHQGQDLLGFQQDIEAFASIVALKELTPPLAIALFGQWGTGKSFFMQKLSEKVEELAKTQGFLREGVAEEGEASEENRPFCEGVCQIQFNAWSYMDTNLWASLVTRIFEGLDDYINDDASAAAKEKAGVKSKIAQQLDLAKGQLDELAARKEQMKNAVNTLKDQVETARGELNDQITKIKGANRQEAIDYALGQLKVKDKLQQVLKSADMDQSKLEEVDPDLILKELKSAHSFVRQLLKFEGRDWIWLVAVLGIFGVTLFAGDWLADQWSAISKALTGALAFVVGAIDKVKKTVNKLSPMVNDVLKVKDEYDSAIKKAISTHEQNILAKQIEADQKEVELNQLNLQLKAKEAEIKALDFSSESVLAQKAMYNFITRKAQSSDYSKHLGIISMIRKDFETLSELFVESRQADRAKLKDKEKKKFSEYDNIRDEFDKPLERIILYIDDLDRCPEERVVEVLEAVNLLMAFPLFVVIVGVDPRWVKNALIKKYQLQFTGQLAGQPTSLALDLEVINPSDYLEKIFQVPFHLMSPADESIQAMIEHLVGDTISEPLPKEEIEEEQAEVAETRAETDDSEEETAAEVEQFDRAADFDINEINIDNQVAELMAEALGAPESVEEEPETSNEGEGDGLPTLIRVTPESLQLHKAELGYMKDFSWLIGNTPRTVKRFVNMYRIIRAHEGLSYTNDEDKIELLIVLFILALRTGAYSGTADQLLDALCGYKGNKKIGQMVKEESQRINADVNQKLKSKSALEADPKEVYNSEYWLLLKRLENNKEFTKLREVTCKDLFDRIRFVKRFSFQMPK